MKSWQPLAKIRLISPFALFYLINHISMAEAMGAHIELMVGVLLGALAIAIKLTGRRQRSWMERDLRVGDLRALNNIAFRRKGDEPASTQVDRLRERGFLANNARGNYRMTLTGWLAVLLRKTSARGVKATDK